MKERKGRGGEPPPRLKSVEGGSRVSWNQPRGDRRGERGRGRERGGRLIGREIWGKRFDN